MHRIGIGAVLLAGAISLVSQTGCVSPAGVEEPAEAPAPAEPQAGDLETKVAALEAEVAALTEEVASAQEEAAAAQAEAMTAEADAAAAQAALSEAEATVMSVKEAASQARAESERVQAETRQAQAEAEALLAAAPAPGIEVSPDQIDISLLDLDSAQVSLAGPDAIYVSSIRYVGKPYSALLRYEGGTTATIERVFGPRGAIIPDSVDLSQTQLSLVAPNILDVANVGVDGRGYSGQLRYTGDNQLEVAGIQRVTLPPTAAQQIAGLREQLAAAQAEGAQTRNALAAAEASAREAQDALAAAEAAAAAARDDAAAARAEVEMMLADAYQPSAVEVAADRLDGSLLSLTGARASLAGPDRVYVTSIEYGGESYSALLRYRGGTTASVEQVYGPRGKLIPDTVGLAQTRLAFMAPDAVDIAYVEVDGQGYSGQLRYAGDNRLEVAGIRRVTLPPTAAEMASEAAAEARAAAAAAVAAAQDSAAAAVSEAEAAAAAAAAAARDEAAAAQAKVEMMLADAYQPSAVAVAADRLDGSLLSLTGARASLAGPDRVYVTSIEYGGESYSALLRYRGGTTASVEQVYGPRGKLIPDTVGLAQTRLAFMAPDAVDIAYVEVDGQGYSGQLRYAGDNRLEVAGIRRVTLPPTAAEMASEAAAEAVAEARAAADAAVAAAQDSAAAAAAARDEAAAAQAKVEMMLADAYQPSAVEVAADRLDGSLLSLTGARASLAGPDRVYVTSIEYGGESYSALLRYRGGTTASVEQVYGPRGKLIPDTVGLAQTRLAFMAPDAVDIAYVEVDGQGYSGQLRYAGDNRLEVAGIRRVTLPPTAAEMASEAAAEAVAEARAAADAAVAAAQDSAAAAAAARDEAAAAQAKVEMMLADAYQPSAVAVAADRLDGSLLSLTGARASLAGPDRVYVTSIEYGGESYSALLRYRGGTTASVEQVYGPRGKLIPDTVGLAQTRLAFMAPDAVDIAYVEVDGQGYSGQLRYAGDNRLEVAGIQRVTLPPTAAQQVSAAEAAAAEAVAAAQAAADAAVAEEQQSAAAAEAATAAAEAAAEAALAEAAAARDEAAAAQAKVDMMRADAYQPSAIAVAAGQLVPGRLSFDAARASLAGPSTVYVSSIMYDGQSYSALLKYHGGTTAAVEQVYGPRGKLIPDSVGLAQTRLAFVSPDVLNISYVEVDGQGYSGQLRYTGGNRLEVAGIQRVTLPPTAAQQVSAAEAAAAAAVAEAEAAAAQARAELAVLMQDLEGRRVVPTAVDFNLVDLDSAQVSVAGPDSIYVSGIRYDGGEFSARLRYTGGNRGVVEALFDTTSGGLPELDLSAPEMEVLGAETMVISNVGIGGVAYSFTLRISRDGQIVISQQSQGHPVRTAAELLRDELLSSAGVTRVVSGTGGGRALPDEGIWLASTAGVVSQTDVEASHAKFAIGNVRQPAAPTLYGVSVRTPGAQKLGYGLHFLGSRTPRSGNTWNFGRSYLVWATREHDFYDTAATQVQLYESFDGNRLMWLNSRNLLQGLSPGLTLEALFNPDDCPEPMDAASCNGSVTILVDGMEQFKVAVSANVAGQAADTIALRALGGPVEFTDLYVHSR